MSIQNVPKRAKKEAGQIIVLMALLVGVLLAALGLALDGGGLYFLARDVQNAVDAAVLAGSYAQCTGGDPVVAAQTAATLNGFDNNGTDNWVTTAINADGEVEVAIRAIKPSFFIQIVRPGDLFVNLSGVGFCSPAVDTSKFGGMNATGSCGCSTSQPSISFAGSDLDFYGGFSTNGSIFFSNGADYDLIDSPLNIGTGGTGYDCTSAVQGGDKVDVWDDPDDDWTNNGDVDVDTIPDDWTGSVDAGVGGSTTVLDEDLSDPLGLNREDFAANGEYGLKIIAACTRPEGCHFTETTTNGAASATPIDDYTKNGKSLEEGIHYASGDINIRNGELEDTDGDGKLEFTFVTPGTISFSYMGDIGGKQLVYYPGTDGILVFSSLTSSPRCTTNTGSTGLTVNTEANVHGLFYVPNANISMTLSEVNYFLGAIIGEQITASMSKGYFIYDPSLLPPKPPEVGIDS